MSETTKGSSTKIEQTGTKFYKSANRHAVIAVDYDKKRYMHVEAHKDCAIIDGFYNKTGGAFDKFVGELILNEPRRTELPGGGYSINKNYFIECDQDEFLNWYYTAAADFSSFGIDDEQKARGINENQWWVLRDNPDYGLDHIINNCPYSNIVEKAKLQLGEKHETKKIPTYVINLGMDPRIPPSNWTVREHLGYGDFIWDPSKVKLYTDYRQSGSGGVKGTELYQAMREKNTLNANVLYFLLEHPELIPEEWKPSQEEPRKHIYFWGTIYKLSDGRISVQCLTYENGQWKKTFKDGQFEWYYGCKAAILE